MFGLEFDSAATTNVLLILILIQMWGQRAVDSVHRIRAMGQEGKRRV